MPVLQVLIGIPGFPALLLLSVLWALPVLLGLPALWGLNTSDCGGEINQQGMQNVEDLNITVTLNDQFRLMAAADSDEPLLVELEVMVEELADVLP